VPGKGDPPAALPLDLQLVLAGHFFMHVTRRGIGGGFGAGALHLLPKE
jgi:hypothetical protein